MIDREWIDKRICHVKKHGDESDVRELAVLYVIKEHMEGEEEGEGHLTQEKAVRWVNSMVSADPAAPHGGKWTMEQVKPVAQKYGVPTEGERFWEFWAVMNALYSDYYGVASKYGMLNPDFFADMAMSWINDRDAVRNKAAEYYEHIVRR